MAENDSHLMHTSYCEHFVGSDGRDHENDQGEGGAKGSTGEFGG